MLPSLAGVSANNVATINPVTTVVTINGNNSTVTYDGVAHAVSGFSATGLVGGESASVITGITASGATATNVINPATGTAGYANVVSGANTNSNYSNVVIGNNGVLTITPATATISATKTYDATTALSGSQVAITGVTVNGVTEVLGYTGQATANNANVAANGTNFVSGVTGLVDSASALASNYVLPSLAGVSANNVATITPATATILGTKVYDGTTNLTTSQVNVSGVVVNGVAETLSYNGVANANNVNVAANGNNFVATGISLVDGSTGKVSNYVLPSMTSASANNNVVVTPVTSQVTVTANSSTVAYNGTAQSVAGYGVTGLLYGEAASVISGINATGATATNVINPATGSSGYVNALVGANTNSNYSNVVLVNGALTITPVVASVNATKVYDSNTTLTPAQVSISGVTVGGVTETLSYVGNAFTNGANVSANGSNFVTGNISLANGTGLASNYVLPNMSSNSANNSATITPVTTAVVVTGNSSTSVYNGQSQNVAGYTVTGLVGSDATTPTYLNGVVAGGATATNAGSYSNVVTNAYTNSNYANVIINNGSLLINPATAKVVANKVYDASTGLTNTQVVISGVNNESLNYSGNAVANNANVAANGSNFVVDGISLTNGSGLASNYVLPSMTSYSANNSVTITPVTSAVVLTANSNAVTYNGAAQHVAGFTATGLVGSDAANSSTLNGFSVSGGTGTNAGSYVNAVTGANSNYSNVSLVDGTLTIAKANLTATGSKLEDGTSNFNGTLLKVTGVNGEAFSASGVGVLSNLGVVQTNQPLASLGTITINPIGASLLANYNPLTTAQTSVSVLANVKPANPINPVSPIALPVPSSNIKHVDVSNVSTGSISSQTTIAPFLNDGEVSNMANLAANDVTNGAEGGIGNAGNGQGATSASSPLSCKISGNGNQPTILDTSILFERNQDTIKPDFFGALNKIASDASLKKVKQIKIVGHTDSTGTEVGNQKLSLRRAEAVQKYLMMHQVAESMIEVDGKGTASPIASNATQQGRAKNRRTDISKDGKADDGQTVTNGGTANSGC